MRTNEERKKLISARVVEIRKQEIQKKKRIAAYLYTYTVAAGLFLLVGICKIMPNIALMLQNINSPYFSGTAAIVGNSEFIGYVLTAIFAFALGACVTLLLYIIRKKTAVDGTQQDKASEETENE